MLTELHVKNLALIEEAEVSFGEGLNILTGETGAGKSLLLGAVDLAVGQKAPHDAARDPDQPTLAELIFSVDDRETEERLAAMEIEAENGQLILTRRIQSGRSICRINGETCTAARLRQAASVLLEVHGQHEHQSLLRNAQQLRLLDAYGRERLADPLEEMAAANAVYQKAKEEWGSFQIDDARRERTISFLQFEIGEINAAALRPGEDEELEALYRRMASGKRIGDTLSEVQALTGNDRGAGDSVGRALRELTQIADLDPELGALRDALADVDGLLADFSRDTARYVDGFSFSEEEFRETESRLDELNRLKSRYGGSVGEILAYRDAKEKELEDLLHFEERREAAGKRFRQARDAWLAAGERLSAARGDCAAGMEQAVAAELRDLAFLSADFRISLTRLEQGSANGFDQASFLISTNPGEPVRPLAEVASGGELSRIMLAIRTCLADRDAKGTLLFDEIDAGISGRTAQAVSEKLARIYFCREF